MTSHDGNGYDLYRELILTPAGPKAYISTTEVNMQKTIMSIFKAQMPRKRLNS